MDLRTQLTQKVLCAMLIVAAICSFNFAFADMNLRADPTGLIFGFSKLELDLPVSSNVTVGPRVGYFQNSKLGTYAETITTIGVTATYSFADTPFSSGWYVAPNLSFQSMKITEESAGFGRLSGNDTSFGLEVVGGYQWFWGSGFNIHLGLGPVFSTVSSIGLSSSDGVTRDNYSWVGTGTRFVSDFSLGFVF